METPEFIKNIDWQLLRKQKLTLLEISEQYDREYSDEAVVIKERLKDLQGIVHLIDAIQDHAVDEMGMSSTEVFGDLEPDFTDTVGEIIGYQVVGTKNTGLDGQIHPDMDASFCLYNLSWCRERITSDNDWELLAIREGDVEDPTMMFDNSPNY